MRGFKGLKKGDYLVEINAYMVFGGGKGQGTRRLEWGYVVDDVGVREKYKYGFIYHEEGSASEIDLSKTKQEWKRDENDAVKAFREVVAQEDMSRDKKIKASNADLMKSDYVGVIGKRIKGVEVEVLRKHEFETQYGMSAITVMKDDEGNMLQHFGMNKLKKGDKKTVDFTVKGHEVAEINKWNKVAYKFTAVNRVK
jgi:archaellin